MIGKYFKFYPVLHSTRAPATNTEDSEENNWRSQTLTSDGSEIFIFICERRLNVIIPSSEKELLKAGDDQFEILLMGALE